MRRRCFVFEFKLFGFEFSGFRFLVEIDYYFRKSLLWLSFSCRKCFVFEVRVYVL